MKLRTFLATYVLFVVIFFAGMSVVSVYMSNSQLDMLKEKSEVEFKTIVSTFTKDLKILRGRLQSQEDFTESAFSLVDDYGRYYQKNGISLVLEDLGDGSDDDRSTAISELSIVSEHGQHFILIDSRLSEDFWNYRLTFKSDASEMVTRLNEIQRVLMGLAVVFSVIAGFALYVILSGIFKPLSIVSKTSRKIAEGHYSERINTTGSHELSSMAEDFNRMAAEIEKQMQILQDEAVHKQQFVDSFAHEIRTPLTSVYGFAEYLLTASLDEEEIIESAVSIMDEAGYMRKISNSLLELATLRNDSITTDKIPLPQLLEGVVTGLSKQAGDSDIEIIFECHAEYIFGQADLLRSLLLNLGFNAIKACTAGSGIIHFEAVVEGNDTIVSVTDNGCGIPEENLPLIDEPFYRVDKARSRESGGAGLGLALCRQIVKAHHARMVIQSKVGEGTRVEVIFTTHE